MNTQCKKCGNEYAIEETFLGKEVKCPKCEAKFFASRKEDFSGKEIADVSRKITSNIIGEKQLLQTELKQFKKIRKLVLRLFLSASALIVIIFLAVETIALYRKLSDVPSPENAFRQAKDFLITDGKLIPNSKTAFSEEYSFFTLSKWKRHYRITSEVTTEVIFLKGKVEIPFEVEMEYIGDNKWNLINCNFLMSNLKEISESNGDKRATPKLIITPFPHEAPIPE